jgi:hypothetical protein
MFHSFMACWDKLFTRTLYSATLIQYTRNHFNPIQFWFLNCCGRNLAETFVFGFYWIQSILKHYPSLYPLLSISCVLLFLYKLSGCHCSHLACAICCWEIMTTQSHNIIRLTVQSSIPPPESSVTIVSQKSTL